MPAELVVVKGKDRGLTLVFKPDGVHTIGRSEDSALRLKGDKKVSTAHATITATSGDRWLLEDLGSTNGTYVNGERISQAPLRTGDRVKIGHTLLVFHADAANVKPTDLSSRMGGSSAGGGDGAGKSDAATPPPSRSRSGTRSRSRSSSAAVLERPTSRLTGDAESTTQSLLAIVDALSDPPDLKTKLAQALKVILSTTRAARAILFLRDPDAGGLVCASAIGRDDTSENVAVDGDVLRRAVGGELAAPSGDLHASAAPVKVQDQVLGALYVDAPGGRSASPFEGRFLGAAAASIASAVRSDRLEKLARTAVEIVALAAVQPVRVPLELASLVAATQRIFGPVAEARGLGFDVALPASLVVLGDETLLSRALDRLVEAALAQAKGGIRIAAELQGGIARLVVSRGGSPLAEGLARELASPQGVGADLESALARLSEGPLALARGAVGRSGGRLLVEPGPAPLAASFVLELPLATMA
jgi:pSer/pThr/pTyr-binding forkhead associated (FHA) protein